MTEWKGPGESPHHYSPDYQAMGDCRICGHTYASHFPPKGEGIVMVTPDDNAPIFAILAAQAKDVTPMGEPNDDEEPAIKEGEEDYSNVGREPDAVMEPYEGDADDEDQDEDLDDLDDDEDDDEDA
jgi:hypothetical protein